MKRFLLLFTILITARLTGQENVQIGNELGILEVKIETYQEKIFIYNKDGSVWMSFGFDYESKLKNKENYTIDDIKKLYKWDNRFNPYFFKIDYSLLMFKCTGDENGMYKVIVDKSTGLEKYIKKEKFWILRNWQDHIINSVPAVETDFKKNPIRTKPNDNSAIVKVGKSIDPEIQPLEIKDNWLKIKYAENDTEKTGWIKWKENNNIIVRLYYLI